MKTKIVQYQTTKNVYEYHAHYPKKHTEIDEQELIRALIHLQLFAFLENFAAKSRQTNKKSYDI